MKFTITIGPGPLSQVRDFLEETRRIKLTSTPDTIKALFDLADLGTGNQIDLTEYAKVEEATE